MRRHVLTWILVAGVLSAAQVGAARTGVRVALESADVAVENVGTFQRLTIEGLSSAGNAGEPALPFTVLRFVIPADTRVEDVAVSWVEEEVLPGTHRVVPAQREVPIGEAAEWVDPDPSIYGSDTAFPSSRVQYLGDGYLGGYRIASVAVYPLTYAPISGKLTLARDISVELELAPGADRSQPRGRMTSRSQDLYRRLVESIVENPEDVAGRPGTVAVVDDAGPEGFLPRHSPSLEGSAVEYVIVTTDEFASQFQTLADQKTREGVPAVVRTVSWIESSYAGGCDTAERIRLFLKDAFSSWGTTYVLIGGDTGVVPIRYASTEYYGGEEIPSDLYYSDLDGSWNADGDDKFGEAYQSLASLGDSLDLYPDVFVGRAPVTTAMQVENFLAKCEAYERSVDPISAERNLYLAEVVFPYDWEAGPYSLDGAANVIEPMLENIGSSVRNVRLYANTAEFPDAHELGAATAIDSLDAGYNLVVHVGHANKDVIRVNNGNYITMSDVSNLANGINRSSIMWMLDCTSVAVDYDCIGERALNNTNGGAVALFGPTRYAFPATLSNYLDDWIELLYQQGVTDVGAVCAMTKALHANPEEAAHENPSRWTQFTTVLLGDPELQVWRGRPASLNVSHAASMAVGETGLAVSVTDSGPVEGALVCASKDGDVYARGTTDALGQVVLDVTPTTTGAIHVTASASDHFIHESQLSVGAATGPFVHLLTTSPDDTGGGSVGNGNSRIESGETVELDVEIRNGGTGLASAVTAVLTSTDPYVTVEQGTVLVGDIAAGTIVPVDDAFRISVDISCPNDHDLALTVDFGATWSEELALRVYRPDLSNLYIRFGDSAGNGNGVPEPGESVELIVDVWNDGNGDAEDVTGTLRYPDHHASVVESTAAWGGIEAGSVVDGNSGFLFFVNQSVSGTFELTLTDRYGLSWTSTIDAVAPDFPQNLTGRVRGTTIELSWMPVGDSDLRGYDVYRSESEFGPFARVSDAIIEGAAFFADHGLAENSLYHYYVTAVDASGNESADSVVLSISTNPPSQAGWPLGTGAGMYASPAVADIDGDGVLEIVMSSEDLYAWHGDGSEVRDGDGDPRTVGVFSSDGTGGYRSSVAIGELDGDPGVEIVAAAWGDVGTPEAPFFEVFAWNGEDGSIVPGWPVGTSKFCWASPALADLDGDGLAEVILPSADGYLYCWKGDGSEVIDGDSNPSTLGRFAWLGDKWVYGSPAVADLDGDLSLEIVQPGKDGNIHAFHSDGAIVDGWPVSVGARSFCSPAIGDVDGDGAPEIAVGSNLEQVWLLEADGSIMDGWPRGLFLNGDFPPSPVLADLTDDGFLEVVLVGSDGEVVVRDFTGQTLPGWPQSLGSFTTSSPAVADIDGDPGMEIVVGANDGRVYCFDSDGALLRGWPIQTEAEVYGSPSISDLDGDGDNEVVVGTMDMYVYVWDCAGSYDNGDGVLWGSFLHDQWRTQYYDFTVPTGVDDDWGDWDGESRLVLEQNSPNPFNPTTEISFAVPQPTGQPVQASLTIFSVDGRVVKVLVNGPLPGGKTSVVWDGTDGNGRRVASGVYFYRLNVGAESESRKMTLLK